MHGANEAQRRYWNDDVMATAWPRREAVSGAVTPVLIERAALAAGERVLDVGSGAVALTLAAARAVAPGGHVVGADFSEPLMVHASRRVAEHGVANVTLALADVQYDPLPGAPFDVALSQFGVMFFDDPAGAFANVRAHVRAGGRLAFACWQGQEENPWMLAPVVAPFADSRQVAARGAVAPPFSFGDPARVRSILGDAGWHDVERTAHRLTVRVDPQALGGDDHELAFRGVPDERLDGARKAVAARLAALRADDGRLDAPLAFQVFTARC